MTNSDLYKGFGPERQAGYEAWLIERYGEPIRAGIERSTRSFAKLSRAEQQNLQEELEHVERALADAMRDGTDPGADRVDALIRRHRAWVASMWGQSCSPEKYSGLADLYLSHPDLVARYESIEAGFAEYLAAAMKAHARR